MYLQFVIIFFVVIVVNSAPIFLTQSFYDVLKSSSSNSKCPYLQKSKLLEPEPEFLKHCNNFTAATLLQKISGYEDVPQALCLLYYNHFQRLCEVSNTSSSPEAIASLISNTIIDDVLKKNENQCKVLESNVEKVKDANPGIVVVMKELQDGRCEQMCRMFDQTFNPICSLTSLMINATFALSKNNAPAELKNEKITKPIYTSVAGGSDGGPKTNKQQNLEENIKNVIQNENKEKSKNSATAIASNNNINGKEETAAVLHNPVQHEINIPNNPTRINAISQDKLVAVDQTGEKMSSSSLPTYSATTPLGVNNINPEQVLKSVSKAEVKAEKKPEEKQQDINDAKELPKPQKNVETPPEVKPAVEKNNNVNENPGQMPSPGDEINIEKQLKTNDKADIQQESEEEYNNEDIEGLNDIDAEQFNVPQKIKEEPKPVEKSKPLETDEDTANFPANYQNQSIDDSDSYFFSYFMMVCIMFICGYVAYHNKQKILALIVEGRKGRRPSRSRRPNSSNYRKLDSNLEEAITSTCSKNTTQVIY